MMHEVASPLEMILTAIGMGFWFLFPLGMFLSVSHVDKNTDQVVRLGHLRHHSMAVDMETGTEIEESDEDEIPAMPVPPCQRPQDHAGGQQWDRH